MKYEELPENIHKHIEEVSIPLVPEPAELGLMTEGVRE